MFDLNKALKSANLYSIEYCGYFILKFSISSSLEFYNQIQDLSVEFIAGSILFDKEKNQINTDANMLSLYGLNLMSAEINKVNQLNLKFDNGNEILSIKDEDIDNDLVDRNWMIYSTIDRDTFLLNDTSGLYYSNNISELLSR